MNEAEIRRALSTVGLCKKAGRLICGASLCCEAMRQGKLFAVLYAAGAAENSVKRVCDKAKTYSVPAYALPVEPETLGKCVGKPGALAAVGITDPGFAKALMKFWNN